MGHHAALFRETDLKAKSQWQMTVPGNHDFWNTGLPAFVCFSSALGGNCTVTALNHNFRHPLAATRADQFGNGFMQYYGQDVYAGKADTANFLDFSSPPPGASLPFSPAGQQGQQQQQEQQQQQQQQ